MNISSRKVSILGLATLSLLSLSAYAGEPRDERQALQITRNIFIQDIAPAANSANAELATMVARLAADAKTCGISLRGTLCLEDNAFQETQNYVTIETSTSFIFLNVFELRTENGKPSKTDLGLAI